MFYAIIISNFKNIYWYRLHRGFHRISDEYNKADINVASGQFLILVEWEDAVIEINFSDDPNSIVTFTKEIGLSLFTFKNEAKIHMEFITGVFYYNFQCNLNSGAILHANNIYHDEIFADLELTK